MDVTRIAEQVLAFLRAEAAELADNLTELEPRVLERMRRIGARVIERRLASGRLGYSGPSRPCGCGRTQRFVEHRPKTLATLLGVEQPFAGGARVLYELTGQRLSESTVMRLTERVGAPAEAAESRQARQSAAHHPPAAEATPERLYIAVDGTMVHRQDGWREANCVTCYWDEPDVTRRTALRALITYIEIQGERLAYGRFRAAGLDIGSGRRASTWSAYA